MPFRATNRFLRLRTPHKNRGRKGTFDLQSMSSLAARGAADPACTEKVACPRNFRERTKANDGVTQQLTESLAGGPDDKT